MSRLPTLNTLAKRINKQREKLESLGRDTAEAAAKYGAMLAEARKQIPHGKWETWVSENCGCTSRTALNYIHLHEWIQGLTEEKRKYISDFTLTTLLAQARNNSPVRQQIMSQMREEVQQRSEEAAFERMERERVKKLGSFEEYDPKPSGDWLRDLTKDSPVEAEFREITTEATPEIINPPDTAPDIPLPHVPPMPQEPPMDGPGIQVIAGKFSAGIPSMLGRIAKVLALERKRQTTHRLMQDKDLQRMGELLAILNAFYEDQCRVIEREQK